MFKNLNDIYKSINDIYNEVSARISNGIEKKIIPNVKIIEKTALGGPLIRGIKNLAAAIYHIGCAVKHLVTGLVSAFFQVADPLLTFTFNFTYVALVGSVIGLGVFFFALKNAFEVLKSSFYDCGKSLRTAAKSLFGVENTALPTQQVVDQKSTAKTAAVPSLVESENLNDNSQDLTMGMAKNSLLPAFNKDKQEEVKLPTRPRLEEDTVTKSSENTKKLGVG